MEKKLLKTPTDAFVAVKEAFENEIKKDSFDSIELEKIRQSICTYVNEHYEVEDGYMEEGKKYICENGATVELINTQDFIAKSVKHEYLVGAELDCHWDRFGHASEEGFNIIGEYNETGNGKISDSLSLVNVKDIFMEMIKS